MQFVYRNEIPGKWHGVDSHLVAFVQRSQRPGCMSPRIPSRPFQNEFLRLSHMPLLFEDPDLPERITGIEFQHPSCRANKTPILHREAATRRGGSSKGAIPWPRALVGLNNWTNIPAVTLLCGGNGSGKSCLLHFIRDCLGGLDATDVFMVEASYDPDSIRSTSFERADEEYNETTSEQNAGAQLNPSAPLYKLGCWNMEEPETMSSYCGGGCEWCLLCGLVAARSRSPCAPETGELSTGALPS